MSGAERFFDTSVLLYLLSSEDEKADRVEQLLAQSGTISIQVLNEFRAVATRKLSLSLTEVREVLDTVRNVCTTHALTEETYDRGIHVFERYRFSLYDSMIVSSALLAQCKTLLSEDLQHGQIIDGQLTVINPFVSSQGGTRTYEQGSRWPLSQTQRRPTVSGIKTRQEDE